MEYIVLLLEFDDLFVELIFDLFVKRYGNFFRLNNRSLSIICFFLEKF